MIDQLISRVRRNHGLEHATIHMLSEKHTQFSAQGNSDHRGFNLNVYGSLSEEDVTAAVQEAYRRLKAGQHHLAVHPNCGTVLLTTATLATLAAQAVFSAEMKRQHRTAMTLPLLLNTLPSAILAVVVALIVSRPLGVQLQAQYTVEGDLGDLQVVSVRRVTPSVVTRVFQLLLTGGRTDLQATAYRIETRD
ncbi:MAG: hypothetical protein KC443_08820 [Anaerolineales bacterium]|nr:hypothetical protein [Anaerolineales bacterium]MCB8966997.1 hypothetical protein [Ardenticatenaceae bacterium]